MITCVCGAKIAVSSVPVEYVYLPGTQIVVAVKLPLVWNHECDAVKHSGKGR